MSSWFDTKLWRSEMRTLAGGNFARTLAHDARSVYDHCLNALKQRSKLSQHMSK